jgi:hypothetical protein
VRHAGRHLAERCQAIPKTLALLELFDLRQILEEITAPAGAVLDERSVYSITRSGFSRIRRGWEVYRTRRSASDG